MRFNPRPRAGGDFLRVNTPSVIIGFNPRPRAGGDLCLAFTAYPTPGFNPRPRAGGDRQAVGFTDNSFVSIHAPARGATAG